MRIAMKALLVSIAAGACVLACQLYVKSQNITNSYPEPLVVLRAISFCTAVVFTTAVFAPCHNFGRAVVFYALFIIAATVVLIAEPFGPIVVLPAIPASMLVVLRVICRRRNIVIRNASLLAVTSLAFVLFAVLSIAVVAVVAGVVARYHFPIHDYDDYVGYTSLTMIWCWCIGGALPFLLRKPAEDAAEEGAEVRQEAGI